MKILGKGLDLAQEVSEAKYLPYKMIWGDLSEKYDKAAVWVAVKRAIEKGLIKKQIQKEKAYVALTDLGRQALNKKALAPQLSHKGKSEDWDGLYRMVIFDIPEKDRIVRDLLRRQLKLIGCLGWQKSVWVTKEDITDELNKFIKENELEDYILVVEVEGLHNEKLERLVDLSEKVCKLG